MNDSQIDDLGYALAKQVPAMERGFTISTSYGDIEIHAEEAGPLMRAVHRILSRRLVDAAVRKPNTQRQSPLQRCAAGSDGDCSHAQCPQNRDGEPAKSGRHCLIDIKEDHDD